jgi:hypothetical protein
VTEIDFNLELTAFAEKVALGELEVGKAQARVLELKYRAARFQMEFLKQVAKEQQQQAVGCTPPPAPVA